MPGIAPMRSTKTRPDSQPGLVAALRRACSLRRQVDTTAAARDRRFAEWCSWDHGACREGAMGTGWDSWEGRFLLSTPTDARAPSALRKAAEAIAAHRATRIVVVIPDASPINAHWAIARAYWVGRTNGILIVLLQNGLAEAVAPCRTFLSNMAAENHVASVWGLDGCAWPALSQCAWSLRRNWPPVLQRTGPGAYFDFGRLGGIWSSSPVGRHARGALAAANAKSDYTRRLGLVSDSYGATLAAAMQKASGVKPTLKAVATALDSLRASAWCSASASFRAAHGARTWMYDNDPANRLLAVEEDRYAHPMSI